MTRQQVEALFARRDRAINQRDAAAFTALYADEAVVESPTAGGPVRGRAAIGAVTRAWFNAFPDMTLPAVRC